MDESTNTATFQVEGFTPFAQIPQWVIRSGSGLSHGAVRLYGVIMTYADNDTKTAFPGREAIANDMGASVASVKRYIKELEEFRALSVVRRRNKRTGNFYSNHYTLSFSDPRVISDPPPQVVADPRTRLTALPIPTDLCTSDSDESDAQLHDHADARPRTPSNPDAGMTPPQRLRARQLIEQAGQALASGQKFLGEQVQDIWDDLCVHLEDSTADWECTDILMDMLYNGKWTLSARVANPYEAGKELNKMIHTARAAT